MKYKRFIVIQYYQYYPAGGVRDFKNSYDTFQEAKDDIKTTKPKGSCEGMNPWDWNHILDTNTMEIIYTEKNN